jgi:phosphoesterase RecJ-like protein
MIAKQAFDQFCSESKKRIDASQNILVTSHIRPDGDAVGSLLGLGLALLEAGKKVQMVLSDGVPASYNYLPGQHLVQKKFKQKYDLAIVVDSSDIGRTGRALDPLLPIDINIDHHLTNEKFASLNLVIVEAASTSEILSEFIPAVGLGISPDVAQNLLAGIVMDTIGFRTPNVSSRTLRIAADLMEKGADLAFLYMKGLNSRSYSAIRFWGYGLSNLERQGDLVWTTLSMADRKSSGYSGRDDADLINILSTIEDAKINLIFVEQPNGHVKVSWRSIPGYDVSQVAILFGGGGHAAASGADVDGNLEKVRLEVINKTFELLLSNN